ncbi:hypothetical protein QO004_000480 [Rhizobium mesoamericanum]|uniref:SPOR domain-containing protein n=1 Tax=Rhizobium mesoamericanum TaxID=1079800 RepID=UPI00278AF170|nr:hypothetical protein [Rhizobium mesoamericanum]MDQ0558705.1 hypothetical protein [Rhizobium mesoamericanum]
MSALVDIKPGQWVLSFHQPYGPYLRTMPELLEGFAFHHWMDSHTKDETFFVLQVQKVMPKTFIAFGSDRYIDEGERLPRSHLIAAFQSEAEAKDLGDKLFAIGVETGRAIEAEMYRRVQKFADRKRAAAERKIHKLLPYFFGDQA